MKRSSTLIIVGLAFVMVGVASGEIVYSNDFEIAADNKWSINTTSTTPSGRKFLGHFFNDSHVFLALDNLPSHNLVTITFDLFIIKSWDGNIGPDLWGLDVVGGSNLVLTTFRNGIDSQNYPNNYPGPLNPPQTGASEVDTLGYPSGFGDSVYQLSYTFEHNQGVLALDFFANGYTGNPLPYGIEDESWGLDNVIVDVVPEPTTLLLMSMGVVMLYKRKRP